MALRHQECTYEAERTEGEQWLSPVSIRECAQARAAEGATHPGDDVGPHHEPSHPRVNGRRVADLIIGESSRGHAGVGFVTVLHAHDDQDNVHFGHRDRAHGGAVEEEREQQACRLLYRSARPVRRPADI